MKCNRSTICWTANILAHSKSRSAAALVTPMMDRGVNLRANFKSIVSGYAEGLSYGLRL